MRVTPECESLYSFVICQAVNKQTNPDIAYGMGNYFVVWMDERSGNGGNYQLYGTIVSPSGTVLHPDGALLNPAGLYANMYPALAAANTRFFLTWYGYPDAILGQFLDSTGALIGDTIHVADLSSQVYQAYHVQVAYDGMNFFVTWIDVDTRAHIKAQLVSGSGTPIGSPVLVADSASHLSLGLALSGNKYLIAYPRLSGSVFQIHGRYYALNGQPIGSEFEISQSGLTCRFNDICPGHSGFSLNVWTDSSAVTANDIVGCFLPATGIAEKDLSFDMPGQKMPTVFCRSIALPGYKDKELVLYDITGSFVGRSYNGSFACNRVLPGIYFLKLPDRTFLKIIKIK